MSDESKELIKTKIDDKINYILRIMRGLGINRKKPRLSTKIHNEKEILEWLTKFEDTLIKEYLNTLGTRTQGFFDLMKDLNPEVQFPELKILSDIRTKMIRTWAVKPKGLIN